MAGTYSLVDQMSVTVMPVTAIVAMAKTTKRIALGSSVRQNAALSRISVKGMTQPLFPSTIRRQPRRVTFLTAKTVVRKTMYDRATALRQGRCCAKGGKSKWSLSVQCQLWILLHMLSVCVYAQAQSNYMI